MSETPQLPQNNQEKKIVLPQPAPENKKKQVSPNKESLTRKIRAEKEDDRLLVVIARTRNSAVEKGKTQDKASELDKEIGSLGFLSEIRSDDSFSPPITIELNGTTYVIENAFTDDKNVLMLRGQNGGAIELSSLLNQTRDKIATLLPEAPETPQLKFIKAYVDSKKDGGQPIDKTILKDAARSTGLLLSEDVLDIAVSSGKITLEEREMILNPKPEKPETPPSEDVQADQKKEEKKPAFSQKAKELQDLLKNTEIPTQNQVELALKTLDIPYSRSSLIDRKGTIVARQKQLPTLLATAQKSGDEAKAIEYTKEIQTLDDELQGINDVGALMEKYKMGNWNTIETYYKAIEEGTLPQNIPKLPEVLNAIQRGDSQEILDAIGDPEKIADVNRAETMRKLKSGALKAGGVVLGLNALMMFLAMRKKEA